MKECGNVKMHKNMKKCENVQIWSHTRAVHITAFSPVKAILSEPLSSSYASIGLCLNDPVYRTLLRCPSH